LNEKIEYVFPASFAQCGHWFLHQLQPDSSFYNVPIALGLTGQIDPNAITRAFDLVLERHEVLRTVFRLENTGPVQIVRELVHPESRMQIMDLSNISFDEADRRARELIAEGIAAPFNLATGPVIRARLISVTASDHRLLIVMHHIVTDNPSCNLLLSELTDSYGKFCNCKSVDPPPLHLQYGDYAVWQRQEGRFEQNLTYWREQLRPPISSLNLPTDRPRPAVQTFNGASARVTVPQKTGSEFLGFCKRRRVTFFAAGLAAYATLLHHHTGQSDLVVGTPVSNRSMKELEPLIGLFLNTVAVRIAINPDELFSELLIRVQQTIVDALSHEVPFEKLIEDLKPERDPSRSPLFQTMFTAQNGGPNLAPMQGLEVAQLAEVTWKSAKFDLSIFLNENDGRITVGAEYNTDLFDATTIEAMLGPLTTVFQAVVENADISIAALGPLIPKLPKCEEPIEQLMQRLQSLGLRLSVESGRLKVNAPKGVMDESVKMELAKRRDEIITLLASRGATNTAKRSDKSLRRIGRTPPLPLSAVQRRFWFVDRFEQERGMHNVAAVLRLEGTADLRILARALENLVERHESLRMRIGERDDEPYPEIIPKQQGQISVVDLTDGRKSCLESEALRLMREATNVKFDLKRGPVSHFSVVRVSPELHFVAITMHHIVADGWSLSIAVRDFAGKYSVLASQKTNEVVDLPLQYLDYAAWEGEQVRAGLFDRQINYWQKKLAGVPSLLELPTDRVRPPIPSLKGDRIDRIIDSDLAEEIDRYSRNRDVTPFMTILAALQVIFHRISGQGDIVIGTPVANRGSAELENVIGPFVNTLALRSNLEGNPSFRKFLNDVRQTTIDAIDHRDVPFDIVVEAVNPQRAVGHAPIFQVMLALHNFPLQHPAIDNLKCAVVKMETLTARFDIAIDMVMYQNKFIAAYEYATDLFDRTTIEGIHNNLTRLLEEIVKDDDRRVSDFPLLSMNDERSLLEDWNDTEMKHDRDRCIHHLFENTARKTPAARAAIVGGSVFTYQDINERANRLAQLLLRKNIVKGDRVAICVDRGVDMPVAMTAVLKVGAAYIPLDPNHPADRLRYTLEDAKTSCVITHRQFAALFAGRENLIVLDEAGDELNQLPAIAPNVAVEPKDVAYIIYTSGSTGNPKGVQVEHRNVVNFLESMRCEPGLTTQDVLLAVTTLSFDIAGLEIWLPLYVGACVVIATREDVLVGERLIALLDQHQITVMQATPSTWRLMLEAGWLGKPDLRILCGGEALPRDLAALLISRVGQLWNMYGPTETTIWSTIIRVEDAATTVPIGRPIANTRVYVLEPSGMLSPIGAFGELVIAGDGVARGYWNRVDLTAEKFTNLTLSDGRIERVYRTGDIVRFRRDGLLEFHGRRDHQVKLRGYRIELGEIEAVLARQPGVKQCVVIIREGASEAQLVGYVVRSEGHPLDSDDIRMALRSKLPGYMVPSQIVVLGRLPLTPNGKIDRKALPAPEENIETSGEATELIMDPVQKRVAEIWRRILKINRVSLHDNFFDVGGHSMLVVKLHGALRREFGSDLTLVELFQQTTVALQAERVSSAVVADDALQRAKARVRKRLHD